LIKIKAGCPRVFYTIREGSRTYAGFRSSR
jgi:hypothetical protein